MTEEEWILLQVLENPVMFREFINEGDESKRGLEKHEKIWTSTKAPYLAMCCGRGVHKTTTMIEMAYYWAINGMFIPGDPGLIIFVPNKAQKDAIFPKFVSAALTHWLIRFMVKADGINVTEGVIKFHNGFNIVMRIAGSAGKESNVISIHGPRIWVDEAQDFPWKAWNSLQNVLRWDAKDHMLWVSGVPNGGREENVLFECDQKEEKYISFNVGQPEMSYWSPEIEYERRKQYHALQGDSEDYKHFVLGQHGVPTFTVFDRSQFARGPFESPKLVLGNSNFDSVKRNDVYHIEELISPPLLPIIDGVKPRIGIGYDCGYSPDPAVFFIMYQDPLSGVWKNLIRYVLMRVSYPLQGAVLAWLDKIFRFDFIGIDMGGPGKAQYQYLTGEMNDYKEHDFLGRIYPVEFGGQIVVAIDDEGEEKRDQMKRAAVEALSKWVHEKIFMFSEQDEDLVSELERTKLTRTITGEPVYKTENDHQMAAMMCAIMAYQNKFGEQISARKEIKPRLLLPHWLELSEVELGMNYGRFRQ